MSRRFSNPDTSHASCECNRIEGRDDCNDPLDRSLRGPGFRVSSHTPPGLHQLALKMERNGWIYYKHRKPTGGGGHLGPFQEIVDPPVRHVWQIREHTRPRSETDVPGEG